MRHPRHGVGGTFHIDVPHYLITEDLHRFASDIDTERAAELVMSDISGRVIWDSGVVSEVTWLEVSHWHGSGPIRMQMHTWTLRSRSALSLTCMRWAHATTPPSRATSSIFLTTGTWPRGPWTRSAPASWRA